jgi:ComF family protein
LAAFLADCYHTHHLKTDLIVPVPLHPNRQKERGYNQSLLLAEQLSTTLGQPLDTKSLIRQRMTQSQMTLKRAERKTNVANAFICQSDRLSGKTILLIDDVCTTGATLNACAEALKNSGVTAVFGLTLARA